MFENIKWLHSALCQDKKGPVASLACLFPGMPLMAVVIVIIQMFSLTNRCGCTVMPLSWQPALFFCMTMTSLRTAQAPVYTCKINVGILLSVSVTQSYFVEHLDTKCVWAIGSNWRQNKYFQLRQNDPLFMTFFKVHSNQNKTWFFCILSILKGSLAQNSQGCSKYLKLSNCWHSS